VHNKGVEAEPPVAILDFYGPKFFLDSFWSSPLPALAQIPDFDESFVNQIFNEPLLTSTATSLEKASAASTGDGHSAPSSTGSQKPRREPGMPKPDLSIPRNAWLFSALKHGTHLGKIVQDGNFDRVDPASGFSATFPPTFFIHGAADALVLTRLSEQAYHKLKDLGVDTGLALVPGASHGFDSGLPEDDPKYAFVREGITFLKNHV
jgi:acetyl esterase/lipase